MPKFTFICEHDSFSDGGLQSKNTYEFKADGLFDVVEEFETFLKGSGYYFDGELDFVVDDFSDNNKIEVEDNENFYLDPQSMDDPFPFLDSDSTTITSQQPETSNGILHVSV
jgi:hypothetical protein